MTGNPSRKKITKQCPAAMASAVRVARSAKSRSLPLRRTNRGPDASQKASPNRSDEPTPTSASCRSSTVLMKWACPITTLTSSGLSTGTTSQESVVEVTHTCCHRHATAMCGAQNANSPPLASAPRSPSRNQRSMLRSRRSGRADTQRVPAVPPLRHAVERDVLVGRGVVAGPVPTVLSQVGLMVTRCRPQSTSAASAPPLNGFTASGIGG